MFFKIIIVGKKIVQVPVIFYNLEKFIGPQVGESVRAMDDDFNYARIHC